MKTKLFIISLMILTLVSCSKEKEPEHNYGDTLTVYSFNDVHGSPVVIVTSGGQLHGFRCPYGFLARLAVDVVDAQG